MLVIVKDKINIYQYILNELFNCDLKKDSIVCLYVYYDIELNYNSLWTINININYHIEYI